MSRRSRHRPPDDQTESWICFREEAVHATSGAATSTGALPPFCALGTIAEAYAYNELISRASGAAVRHYVPRVMHRGSDDWLAMEAGTLEQRGRLSDLLGGDRPTA